jgi:hypothetical protein
MVQRKVPASKIGKTSENKSTSKTVRTTIASSPTQNQKAVTPPPKQMQNRRTQGR